MAIAGSRLGHVIALAWHSDDAIVRRLRARGLVREGVADGELRAQIVSAREEDSALPSIDRHFNSPDERLRVLLAPFLSDMGRRWAVPLESLDDGDDPDVFELGRFVEAQRETYDTALAELRDGRKRSHWMWFIFPQLAGLGFSAMSQRYAIRSLEEAMAYLEHPLLGYRLLNCAAAVLQVDGRTASEIFGSPDDLKLRSSATLFSEALSRPGFVFDQLLTKYFGGEPDSQTLDLLKRANRRRMQN
jgi:uncharacterized protein (DUF1810 family)